METSIDEGLETEGEAEEDPSQAFDAFQSTRSGQRRHTLSEVTNQLVVVPGSGRLPRKHRVERAQHKLRESHDTLSYSCMDHGQQAIELGLHSSHQGLK